MQNKEKITFKLFLPDNNDLKSFVDKNIFKQSSFKRTIKAGESNGFYVVILCLSEGAKGVLRSELNIYDRNLLYRIKIDDSNSNYKLRDMQIYIGNINFKK
ncbi:hypothetical protein HNQ02_000375 [Flavobacterium sp. 7E]|uniref:hypothetical protein n=1 Tax=Flavobacterium sp. 7E TaxID=2735898 RepID=UPI001570021B|nr:hypothetical protein [Flavobacterium sp. 7E]NRS87468.1 hypothetical protein [Flavobacterium sp. 7E]